MAHVAHFSGHGIDHSGCPTRSDRNPSFHERPIGPSAPLAPTSRLAKRRLAIRPPTGRWEVLTLRPGAAQRSVCPTDRLAPLPTRSQYTSPAMAHRILLGGCRDADSQHWLSTQAATTTDSCPGREIFHINSAPADNVASAEPAACPRDPMGQTAVPPAPRLPGMIGSASSCSTGQVSAPAFVGSTDPVPRHARVQLGHEPTAVASRLSPFPGHPGRSDARALRRSGGPLSSLQVQASLHAGRASGNHLHRTSTPDDHHHHCCLRPVAPRSYREHSGHRHRHRHLASHHPVRVLIISPLPARGRCRYPSLRHCARASLPCCARV